LGQEWDNNLGQAQLSSAAPGSSESLSTTRRCDSGMNCW
jgi:hypothetical protein